MSARLPIVSGAGLALMIVVTGEALAGAHAGYVTAYSDYGNGAVRAPVRAAQYGYQVRLPGGYWYDCERSSLISRIDPCSDTLRRQTLDFWETMSEEQGGRR